MTAASSERRAGDGGSGPRSGAALALVLLLALVCGLLPAACGSIALVPSGEHRIAGLMTVRTDIAWNRPPTRLLRDGTGEVWTADGLVVDTLVLIAGLEDGRPIFRTASRLVKERKVPVFRARMLPGEIAELVEASFASRMGVTLFAVERLVPYEFAGAPGFEMTFRMTMADEVERRGIAAGAVVGARLYLVVFEAPSLHYFDRYRAEVERLIASARVPSVAGRRR